MWVSLNLKSFGYPALNLLNNAFKIIGVAFIERNGEDRTVWRFPHLGVVSYVSDLVTLQRLKTLSNLMLGLP